MSEEMDKIYMRRCLQIAANGRQNARPNPMVGAVIVCDGRIIGEGYHVRCGEGHAEVNAFASVKNHICQSGTMLTLWQDTALRRPHCEQRREESGRGVC